MLNCSADEGLMPQTECHIENRTVHQQIPPPTCAASQARAAHHGCSSQKLMRQSSLKAQAGVLART